MNPTKMRILITGGAGCLGSNLIEYWLPRGYLICVIDNFVTGNRYALPNAPGLTVVKGSISNAGLVHDCFNRFKPTHVVHTAASYKDPSNWTEDTATNILGTIHVAKAALEHGVRRFINFQTALCYGRPSQVPIPIDHPTAPFTSYGISKTAGEAYLMLSNLPLVSLRIANICGPRLTIGPIPTFYQRLKAGKSCFCSDTVRDFLDMSDFLTLMDIVISDDVSTGIFNVATGEGHSIKDVFNAVANYLGISPPDVPIVPAGKDDVPVVVLDPRETERTFGWRAQISFKETINRQLKWYDDHGVTDIFSHLSVSEPTITGDSCKD
jgi:UDP-glucose 4-epimerase